MEKKSAPEKIVSKNRRARHEYHILESFECGLVLQGHEVKSIREGRVNIQDAYGTVREDEAFLEHAHRRTPTETCG
jgi:SsrA-binding protein